MLPAADLAEIISSLASLKLEPATTAAVLGAVLAPLIRSAPPQRLVRPRQRAERPRVRPGRAAQQKHPQQRAAAQQKRKYKRGAPDARDRAHAALKANPGISLTKVAALAGVSRSTVCNAARELEAAAHKQARKQARQASATAAKPQTEARARAQQFLRDELAHGPKPVSAVEGSAAKAHIDEQLLGQARRDLGVVASRANAGGVQAVQWSLPG